jgi:hypothetical protein
MAQGEGPEFKPHYWKKKESESMEWGQEVKLSGSVLA